MSRYADFHRRSITDRDAFWAEQARLIDWQVAPTQVCDYSNPPFARWYAGGTTNLCHNAVDRHLKDRADQPALIQCDLALGDAVVGAQRQQHGAGLDAQFLVNPALIGGLRIQVGSDLYDGSVKTRLEKLQQSF